MKSAPTINKIKLTDKPTKDVLCILWLGEFGHLLMNTLPRINKIRLERPNTHIIVASYEEDMIYFRDNKGDWTIDEYWGIPWWATDRGCHECKGEWPDFAKELQSQVSSLSFKSNKPHEVIDTTKMSLAGWTAEFKKKPRIAYPLNTLTFNEAPIDYGRYCVIYARAKNYSSTLFRSWHDDRWLKFVELLQKEYNGCIYICGVGPESVQFPWSDRVINYTNMTGLERSSKTLNILANAEFCISDCSGSANFAIQVGTPTFVSGPPGYAEGFEKNKNYFGSYVLYQTCERDILTPELRMDGWRRFMSNYRRGVKNKVYEGIV